MEMAFEELCNRFDRYLSRLRVAGDRQYAVFRRYEHGDSQYFEVIASRFDSADGVVHGLVHRQNLDPRCMCLACVTRRP